MRHLVTLFVIGILFIFGIQPGFASVSAQDVPVEAPAPTTDIIPNVEVAADQIISTVINFVGGTIATLTAGGLVTVLTAITKRLPFFQNTSAGTIAFAWSVVITVAATGAAYFGFQIQFQRGLDILIASLPGVMMLLGIPVAASYYHEQVAKLPGGTSTYIGYKRSPEPATIEAIPASALASYQPIVTTIDEDALVEKVMARFGAYLDAAGFNWTPPKDNAVG